MVWFVISMPSQLWLMSEKTSGNSNSRDLNTIASLLVTWLWIHLSFKFSARILALNCSRLNTKPARLLSLRKSLSPMKKHPSATLSQEVLLLNLLLKWPMRACKQLCLTSRLDLSLVCSIFTLYLRVNPRPLFNARKITMRPLHNLISEFYKRH